MNDSLLMTIRITALAPSYLALADEYYGGNLEEMAWDAFAVLRSHKGIGQTEEAHKRHMDHWAKAIHKGPNDYPELHHGYFNREIGMQKHMTALHQRVAGKVPDSPEHLDYLSEAVGSAIREQNLKEENEQLKKQVETLRGLLALPRL